MNNHSEMVSEFYDGLAEERDKWKKKNRYYHKKIEQLYAFLIPKNQHLLELGCGTGDLLASLYPKIGVGIDISKKMLLQARKKYPTLHFLNLQAEQITINDTFDYIIYSDLIGDLSDIQKSFGEVHKVSTDHTRIIISYYNLLWEPLLLLAEKLGLKMPQPSQNWLSDEDIENLLSLSNMDIIKKGTMLLIPIYIPFFSEFINRYIATLPIVKNLCLIRYFIVRTKPTLYSDKEYSVSIVIPARNEQGNIENAVLNIPKLGTKTEIIFIEGHSKDNTKNEIKRVIKMYKDKKNIILVEQKNGIGKADAVRLGFQRASGEILIIFDADLTVNPEELPKFYHALRLRKGEFIQGSRLVYPMEKEAMRILNIIGNKFFSTAFSWILGQTIKDTLCGTKILFKEDYIRIASNRSYFGDFDPFGDFDLIFGASKLNLKMVEIPIRYRARTYGTSNISRFKHGLLLLKMTLFAAKKLKFI